MKTITNTNCEVLFPLVKNPKWGDTLQRFHYIRQASSRILNKMFICSYLLTSFTERYMVFCESYHFVRFTDGIGSV